MVLLFFNNYNCFPSRGIMIIINVPRKKPVKLIIFFCFRGADGYSKLPSEAVLVNTIGLLIIIFAALVVYLATHRNYKRIPLPEDAILLTGHNE